MCTQRVCSWCACSEGCVLMGSVPLPPRCPRVRPVILPRHSTACWRSACLRRARAAPRCSVRTFPVEGPRRLLQRTEEPRVHPHKAPCSPLSGGVWAFHLQPPSAAPIHPAPRAHRPQRPLFQWNVLAACLERAFLIGFACLNCELVPGVRIRRQTLCPQGVISKKIDSFFVSEMKVLS